MKETPTQRILRALEGKEITLEQINDAMDEVEKETKKEERPMNLVFWVVISATVLYIAGHIIASHLRSSV